MIPTNDIWIAATAIQHGMKLVSNDAHFSNIAGLTVESWENASEPPAGSE